MWWVAQGYWHWKQPSGSFWVKSTSNAFTCVIVFVFVSTNEAPLNVKGSGLIYSIHLNTIFGQFINPTTYILESARFLHYFCDLCIYVPTSTVNRS